MKKILLIIGFSLMCSCSLSHREPTVNFHRCVHAIRAGMNAACAVGCDEGVSDKEWHRWKECFALCKDKVNKAFDDGLVNGAKK